MSGWVFLGMGFVVAMVDLLVGLHFTRMTGEQLERLPDGSVRSPEGIHRVGRIAMLAAPLVFLVFAAIAFGFISDVGIEPITLGGGS